MEKDEMRRIASSVCCNHAMISGPTSKRPASYGSVSSGQLLMMRSTVYHGSPYSPPVYTPSYMICSEYHSS